MYTYLNNKLINLENFIYNNIKKHNRRIFYGHNANNEEKNIFITAK